MKRVICAAAALVLGAAVLGGCKEKDEQKPVQAASDAVSKGLSDAGSAVSDAGKAVTDMGKE